MNAGSSCQLVMVRVISFCQKIMAENSFILLNTFSILLFQKALATGSNFMMKKKHMSSMVQKWQKVKIEVEKEDRVKEMRQAAIRRKIEELKSVDKSEK